MAERGRPRQFDREAALERALEQFWARGYEGTSMADLTAAMGINAPSLYAAFGDKAALFRAAVDRYGATWGEITERALREAPTVRAAVAGMLHAAVDAFTTRGKPRGCFMVLGATNCAPENDIMALELGRRRRARQDDIRVRLDRAVADGELPSGCDVRALAAFYGTVLNGISLQARDGATRKELHAVADAAMAALDRLLVSA